MTMESETEGSATEIGVAGDSLPKLDRPGFDCDTVLKRLGNNRALYARMARAFEKDQSLLMGRLHQNLSLSDLHTIKGVSATMGATALSRAAAKAESALKSGTNPAGIILLTKEIERLFDEACLVFKDLAEELDPTPARAEAVAGMESEAIVTALVQLEAMLMEGNMDAMQYYEETIAGLGCVGAKKLLPLLDDAMQELDFTAAAELCREMRERVK